MIMDIVIDSSSIIDLFSRIFRGLILAVLLISLLNAFFISIMHYSRGNKLQGNQFLIIGCMLIGSYALLFCVLYYGANINLLKVLLA